MDEADPMSMSAKAVAELLYILEQLSEAFEPDVIAPAVAAGLLELRRSELPLDAACRKRFRALCRFVGPYLPQPLLPKSPPQPQPQPIAATGSKSSPPDVSPLPAPLQPACA